ncbi:MAG TPA: hydrogenase formation protein HypD [Candidatus Bathyarchaeia archaeon]|nr:hydrogenase formation protein HypD [Candidatus Bathyarchaeia archaeon]
MYRYRDRELGQKIAEKLRSLDLHIRIMHVCGTHQDTIIRHGLDSILKECGVEIRQGPGCPVCVTTPREIHEAITLAQNGKIVATYGDMFRVVGIDKSLADAKAEGYGARIVYSAEDAVKIARASQKDVVFMAVGFETTAPATASILLESPPRNFSVLSCHRYVPPALKTLIEMGEFRIDGLIEPGHVSTIIGLKPYREIAEKYGVPQVVAGFEPLDILMAVYMLAKRIIKGEAEVDNEYTRAVMPEGNPKALAALDKVFVPFDVEWRGFPTIPSSGMKLRKGFEGYDARKVHERELQDLKMAETAESKMCRCGDVLRGIIESRDCPLFGNSCTPQTPMGPCMVSLEGSCNIEYRYRDIRRRS